MRFVFHGIVCAILLAPVSGIAGNLKSERPVVIELFTSQGCSSCPPADRLLTEICERDDIIALSAHIDYWDYIGWKDRFALPENTERQRAYAKQFEHRTVYTPQVVIDGRAEVTGAHRAKVLRVIDQVRANTETIADIRFVEDGTALSVTVTPVADSGGGDLEILLFRFDRGHDISVTTGENAGRDLFYSHVVREVRSLGRYAGEAVRFDLPADIRGPAGNAGLAVILQRRPRGPIVGAAMLRPTG